MKIVYLLDCKPNNSQKKLCILQHLQMEIEDDLKVQFLSIDSNYACKLSIVCIDKLAKQILNGH
jgi:hypothetical protein